MGKVNLTPLLRSHTITSVLTAHDAWLNQSVSTVADVLFKSVHTSGNITVGGDFTVLGNQNITESSIVKYKSHILIVNDGEMGPGVRLNEAGIEVDRGMLENVRIVFREDDRTFRVGKISGAQAIATREDAPEDGGLMVWDSTLKRMKSTKTYQSDLHLTSKTTSTDLGTGAFIVDGDSSFSSNVRFGGRLYISGSSLSTATPFLYTSSRNDLHLKSQSAIVMDAENISIPFAKPLWFGDASAIYSENVSGIKDLYISTNETGRVRFPSVQDATNKTTASVVLNGGMSLARTMLLGGDGVDYALWASDSNTLKIHSRNTQAGGYPTTVSLLNNTLAPNTELQINGPPAYGHLSLKFLDDRFMIQPSSTTADLVLSSQTGASRFIIHANGSATLSCPLSLLTAPSANDHATTKRYLDDSTRAIACKIPVRVATTSPGTVAEYVAGTSVDGVLLQPDDRIFVKDATDPIFNGVWVIVDTTSQPIRALDFKIGYSAKGSVVFVAEGIVNASSGWICSSASQNDVVGTNTLSFIQFTGLGQVIAGSGLVKNANTINANVDNFSLEINADAVRLSNTGISTGLNGGSGTPLSVNSQLPHVTEVGTLAGNSDWNGKTLKVAYGGTGRTAYSTGALLYGNSTSATGALADDARLVWDTVNGVLNVDGDVSVTGTFNGGIENITSTLSISNAINCTSITIFSANIVQNGMRNTLTATLEITPILSHTKTSFEILLPSRSTTIANRMEVFCTAVGTCELDQLAGVDGIVNVENIVAVGLVDTKMAYLSFTCNEADNSHQFNLYLSYLQT